MKLSEMSTDRMFDVLARITPKIGIVVTDKEFMDIFRAQRESEETHLEFGLRRIIGVLPFLFEKYRHVLYEVISAVNEKSVDEVAAQKGLQTTKEILDILQDKELMAFFQ